MIIEKRIVCFLDILGFKEIIKEFEKTNNVSIIEKISKAYESAFSMFLKFEDPEHIKRMNLEPEKVELLIKDLYFKTFSDNIIITLRYGEINASFYRRFYLVILFSSCFQNELLSNGVYCRGGISFGSFFSDNNIIFSPALVDAYELECKKATFPRIVLDYKLVDLLERIKIEDADGYKHIVDALYTDNNNIVFLSPFGMFDSLTKEIEDLLSDPEFSSSDNPISSLFASLPEEIRTLALRPHKFLLKNNESKIETIISKTKNTDYSEDIRKKYLWLLEFYNWKYESKYSDFQFKTMMD